MTQTMPLTKYVLDDLLGAEATATVTGRIVSLQAKTYPGLPGPATATVQLDTGAAVTLPLTHLTLTEPEPT